MRRTVFDEDHDDFRSMVRAFVKKEIVPRFDQWEKQGRVDKEFYARLAEVGILGMAVPEQYGGGGQSSYKFSAVLTEETVAARVGMGALRVHMDIAAPYLIKYGTEEQKSRWLPAVASGRMMLAIAMTEPGTGSDLAGVTTSAVLDGDAYVLNGSKTFITGALNADAFIVVARTSAATAENRRGGMSLIVVDASSDGLIVGPNFEKLGLKSQDTAELSFDGVRVPVDNLLGDEGSAFTYLESNLPQERLSIAVGSLGSAKAAIDLTVEYSKGRAMFGRTLNSFQNTKFVLASCATEVAAAQAFVDSALDAHDRGELDAVDAAKLKLFCAELQGRVVDQCLQLFGGYGYMMEYPITRMYADARVTRIYGGTSEIMKTIIAKSLGL